ncbi:sulfatase-like hydrolase/transferase [Nocardia carnea]|uniref:Sulfatase-like hydrolase/transferase n=1 Tax=Nocardia carnea TaxID=37328 RepID=A0ABW7TQM8_9NOCA|nr:sulfatase-like hydrolase/transferase [Nocardia carnea]
MTSPFGGRIGLDVRDSVPDWGPYTPRAASDGAPNILVILYDDTGMDAWAPYGGRIQMPTLQRLADNGLTYTQWHTTALCSPTRSIFLTGRNHNLNRCGSIMEATDGFPGAAGRIPPECDEVANPADHVRPWSELNDDEKRLFARMAEAFAALSEYTDVETGRLIDYLEETGQLDNTLIIYCADNGASGEGTPNGSVNENKFFNGYPDDLAENMRYLDAIGSPQTYNHYPTGWAAAFSTPFQMFKRYSQFSGGTCDPLVIHWPAGTAARGQLRHQYHHATDIVPTILEAAGLEMPAVYRGVQQHPLSGVSMRYSFDRPEAPTTKHRQYYAMLGTRGIWEDGWKAAALHAPLSGRGGFDSDRWELYHVDRDRAEAHDLSGEYPEKLNELIAAWFEEAERNDALPLDDRTALELLTLERPLAEPPRDRYVYYPDTAPVPEAVAVDIRGRSYKIVADVSLTGNAEGVLFAHGSRFGGHALFILEGRLYYVYNFLGIQPEQVLVSPEPLPAGPLTVGFEFTREGTGEYGESLGVGRLHIGEQVVAENRIRTQAGPFTLAGDGLCVGYDSGDAVSRLYRSPFRFTGGELLGAAVDVSARQYRDLEREAAAAFARE